MSGILAQGARFHLWGMPRNYALTVHRLTKEMTDVDVKKPIYQKSYVNYSKLLQLIMAGVILYLSA